VPRIGKSIAFGVGILLYVWVAGVRNVERVKAQKKARRAI
jgi:hypothetical protein